MVSNSKVRLPLKWHGGKGAFNGKLAKWILSLLPKDNYVTYAEPFFGGGSVLLHRHKDSIAEAVNDLNLGLAMFWHCLSNIELRTELIANLQLTAVSELSYEQAALDVESLSAGFCASYATSIDYFTTTEKLRLARAFFIQCRMSRQGLNCFASPALSRTRGGMSEIASAYLTAVDGLMDVAERMRSVVVHYGSALDFISLYDHSETVFYLDPPYLKSTRTAKEAYAHEMSYNDHVALLDKLAHIKGRFALSGYHSELYAKYADFYRWRTYAIEIANNASSADSKPTMQEFLWTNYTTQGAKI